MNKIQKKVIEEKIKDLKESIKFLNGVVNAIKRGIKYKEESLAMERKELDFQITERDNRINELVELEK